MNATSNLEVPNVIIAVLHLFLGQTNVCQEDGWLMRADDTMKNVMNVRPDQDAVYVVMWLLRKFIKDIQESGDGTMESNIMMNVLWRQYTMISEQRILKKFIIQQLLPQEGDLWI